MYKIGYLSASDVFAIFIPLGHVFRLFGDVLMYAVQLFNLIFIPPVVPLDLLYTGLCHSQWKATTKNRAELEGMENLLSADYITPG